jgi:hypothetical protein
LAAVIISRKQPKTMKIKGPHDWNEKEIWDSILYSHFVFLSAFATEVLEWWVIKFGFRKEEYIEMNE